MGEVGKLMTDLLPNYLQLSFTNYRKIISSLLLWDLSKINELDG